MDVFTWSFVSRLHFALRKRWILVWLVCSVCVHVFMWRPGANITFSYSPPFFFFLFDTGCLCYMLCSPGCPGPHCVDLAGLKYRDPPACASQVLRLKLCDHSWLYLTFWDRVFCWKWSSRVQLNPWADRVLGLQMCAVCHAWLCVLCTGAWYVHVVAFVWRSEDSLGCSSFTFLPPCLKPDLSYCCLLAEATVWQGFRLQLLLAREHWGYRCVLLCLLISVFWTMNSAPWVANALPTQS